MSRRSQHFRRFLQAGDNVGSLAARIIENTQASKIKRFEKVTTTDKDGNKITRLNAVDNTSSAIKPEKAQRLAATILRHA